MRRFVNNCRLDKREVPCTTGALTNVDLFVAEGLWISLMQQAAFPDELRDLQIGKEVSGCPLLALHPFVDDNGLMCWAEG